MSQNRNTSLVTNKASTLPDPTPPSKETKVPIENIHLICSFLFFLFVLFEVFTYLHLGTTVGVISILYSDHMVSRLKKQTNGQALIAQLFIPPLWDDGGGCWRKGSGMAVVADQSSSNDLKTSNSWRLDRKDGQDVRHWRDIPKELLRLQSGGRGWNHPWIWASTGAGGRGGRSKRERRRAVWWMVWAEDRKK